MLDRGRAAIAAHAHGAAMMQGRSELDALAAVLAPTLGDTGSATWFVGGVVRDALLGRELPDVDLVTAADPERVARQIARSLDAVAFPLSDRHGAWRVTRRDPAQTVEVAASDEAGLVQVDVAALRAADLGADLSLRDFTINAMAVPVVDPLEIIDPHDGQSDLVAGTLRMVAPRAFDDDPLRMLRAVRIAHSLGFEIDVETAAAIRARAHRAAEPSGERIFSELCQLVELPESRRGMRALHDVGLEHVLLPELFRCRGIAQSRFHHLDVHEHTLAVLDNTEDLLNATEFWLPTPDDLKVDPFTAEQRRALLFAALAHDLGKPDTFALRSDGSPSFVGHDRVGEDIVDQLCDRWKTSNDFRSSVKRLVGTHLALGFLLHGDRDRRAAHRFFVATRPVSAEAIVLSVADRLATAGPDDRRKWVRAHLDTARMLWVEHWTRVRDGVPAPLLDGSEIAEAAGLRPGPTIGVLVAQLAEEQAIGAVTTRAQAIELVRAAVSESPTREPSRGT